MRFSAVSFQRKRESILVRRESNGLRFRGNDNQYRGFSFADA